MRTGLLVLVVVAAAAAGFVWLRQPATEPASGSSTGPERHAETRDEQPTQDRSAVVFPKGFRPSHPPGTRTPMQVAAVESGIPMGDGQFLPPLNGVKVADGIPPIRRDRRLPPPGPVVAKVVDQNGQEWWVHEDGSQTSCSYASITNAAGEDKVIVSTQHGAARAGHGELGK